MSDVTEAKKQETQVVQPYLAINVEKGGRKYMFSMEVGSPIGEAYDAAYFFLSELLKMSEKAHENAKPQEEKKEEAVKEEEK